MPRLLDLFCGAGGCSVGYHRAGFDEIVGVDINPQPRYPFQFVQDDAFHYLAEHYGEFDAIHASPPCQGYSKALRHMAHYKPMMIVDLRQKLFNTRKPYVIENVIGAPLLDPVLVCGTGLGLPVRRHRLFECSFPVTGTVCYHKSRTINPHRASSRAKIGYAPERQWAIAMGVDWMQKAEARQAIPPTYTEFIGKQLIEHLNHGQMPIVI